MQGEATIVDERHHLALELLAAKALAEQEYRRAFELSDRRCRIAPSPQPHAYLLRAEASFRLGQKRHAIADLENALRLSPNDTQANRRMLAWSSGQRQRLAAETLLETERDIAIVRRAIDILQGHGRTNFASLTVLDDKIEGWAVWNGAAVVEVSIAAQNSTTSSFIEADPFHELSNIDVRAASFSLSRPKSSEPQSFAISIAGRPFFTRRAPGNEKRAERPRPRLNAIADAGLPSVIIPVYGDFAATKACLRSVSAAMRQSANFRVVIVDDAAPDHRIKGHLADFAQHPGFELLTNSQNLGFIGSINRALKHVGNGDIVLLNSDTIVAPGFIDRLAATAYSSADIGTVIPLSNNGEFASFPIPDQINKLGTYDNIVELDKLAATANDISPVDIPSGIGFCLYIKRDCLDAVGPLSEGYQRGYLEDVDFCLRAREAGFRSVCAPSVYVGHAGSRSFKSEKRSLVVRNLEVLDSKFPSYRHECSAFVDANALRPAREAIERLIPEHNGGSKIIVTGGDALRAVAQARANALQSRGQRVLILEVASDADAIIRPVDPAGGSPQNVRFVVSQSSERDALDEFLRRVQPSGFEILDPKNMPSALLAAITDGGIPYDIFIADSGLFYPPDFSFETIASQEANRTDRRRAVTIAARASELQLWQNRWRGVAERAAHVLVPSMMAKAFASRHLPGINITVIQRTVTSHPLRRRPCVGRLGILALWNSAEEFTSIRKLTQSLFEIRPDISIVIIGATLDDQKVMKSGNTFVTGHVAENEIPRVLVQYGVGSLLIGLGRPLFGHPCEVAAMATGLPVARVDWTFANRHAHTDDLAMDPNSDPAHRAALLVDWMEGR